MRGERAERRLAAILAADVAGYSRLMGADEEGTLRRLQAHRRELITPKIGEHRGRLVKTTGDGLLVEFASVVDAVRCAAEVQRAMIDREAGMDESERIAFRIGVNLGDVIVEDGDIFGDGVNIAARLEALAEPGGVCVSRVVRNQVRDKLPYEFEDLGEQEVKNIARPVRVDALRPPAIAGLPPVSVVEIGDAAPSAPKQTIVRRLAAAAAALLVIAGVAGGWWAWSGRGREANAPPKLSIVVLPLANLSNDPSQDYFADSITDDLTTDLSRIEGSFVISRTTAFTYKGKSVDAKQIGHDLGVRYVLEGSVRRLGEQVEVNVQLIDAESGAHVWADRFNTDRANLANAQEEIVTRLARSLNIALLESAGHQIDQEKNPDARDLVMRGWALYYKSATHRPQALAVFEKALELDPQSTGAKIGIATLLEERVATGASKSPAQDLTRGEKLALEVVERDPNNSQAYTALGSLHRLQNRLAESRVELEKAVALDRNNATAILQLGITLLLSGEPEAALPQLEQSLRLMPRSANIYFYYVWLGYDHLLMNHPDRAIEYFRKASAAAPGVGVFLLDIASALALKGDIEGAKTALADGVKLSPQLNTLAKFLSLGTNRNGDPKFFALRKKTFEAGLLRAGLPEK